MRDRLKDILTRHCITVKATEYFFGRRKLSRISLILPAGYEGQEFVIMPKEVLEQLERELRLTELTLRLCYGKLLSRKFIAELIRSLSLEEKVELAYKIVEEVLHHTKRYYGNGGLISVACSGGKASVTTLDIVYNVLERYGELDRLVVLYEDTGLEYPGNTDYVIKLVKEYYRLRLVLVRSKVKPFQVWKLFGLPRPGRTEGYEPACCLILKKLAALTAYRKLGVVLEFVGIQACESFARMHMIEKGGIMRVLYRFAGAKLEKPLFSAMPVALFTDQDLWKYMQMSNVPVNQVYDRFGVSRQGCMLCTNTISWREHLERVSKVLGRDLVKIVENFMKRFGIQKKKYTPKEIINRVMKAYGYRSIEDMYIIRVI